MAEENKYMDDAFKQASKDVKVTYNASFWEEAKSKLDDALLDDAFKAAAAGVVTSPSFEATEGVDDMFMDSAFVDAAAEQDVSYDSSYFEQFIANEGEIAMDEAFVEAAGATVVDYLPEYWADADKALRNEGLHYEYNSAYWNEAKRLLDRADRKGFFMRWSAAATLLLLFSLSANLLNPKGVEVEGMLANNTSVELGEYESTHLPNMNIVPAHEALMADKEFANYTSLVDQNSSSQTNNNNLLANQNDQNTNVNGFETTSTSLNVSQSNGTADVLKTNVSDFESLDMNTVMAESNKDNSELTHVKIGSGFKTPMKQIGYVRAIPEIKIEKPDPKTMHRVGFLAEAGIGNKWGNFSYVPTLRTGFGVEYLLSSGKKFNNFEFGANFKVNHIRQSQLGATERSDVYDIHGNVNKYWRKLQLKDMVYANVNGLLNYRIAPDHKLKFGVGVEYLVGVRSNMSYVDDFTSEITTVNNNWGVKEGLTKVDMRFSVGYEYEVSNRLTFQINSTLGVFDRTDDSFIDNSQSDREINLMMGLKYNFIKKLK